LRGVDDGPFATTLEIVLGVQKVRSTHDFS
jgi:hypothetical protein